MTMLLALALLQLLSLSLAQEGDNMETITGTIFCNNGFAFYVNGELVAEDPIPIQHNAVNVSFTIPRDEEVVLAIEGRDLADDVSGLEFDNRCLGGGSLRVIFSNGVVTNSSWVCTTHHYGPTNWKDCFAGKTVRDQSLQLLPGCMENSTPQIEGCVSRITPRPEGWNEVGFDDSRWEFAFEYTEAQTGYGFLPAGCETPGTLVSSDVDPNGDPITCQNNVDWGDSEFIWRADIDLDNTILCRYTLGSSGVVVQALGFLAMMLAVVVTYLLA